MKKSMCMLAVMSGLVVYANGTLVVGSIDLTGGTSTQSSSWSLNSPTGVEAIDGNLVSFTHTGDGDTSPTWGVDFGRDHAFNQIIVHNRDECCQDRLSDFTVRAFDASSGEVFNSGVVNPGNAMSSPDFIVVDLPSVTTVRSLLISRNGTTGGVPYLSIGEVQIGPFIDQTLPLGTNLTQAGIVGMSVRQSTRHDAGPASNGVDDNLDTFTHTDNSDTMPWYRVDLGEVMSLEQVFMFNRTNCCGERLRDITLRILDDNGGEVFNSGLLNPGNIEGFSGSSSGQLSVDLAALNGGAPIGGQTVEISRTEDFTSSGDDAHVLALGEVQVIGGSLIPEPAATALLGLGCLAMLSRCRN